MATKDDIVKLATDETKEKEKKQVETPVEETSTDDGGDDSMGFTPDFTPGVIAQRSIVDEMKANYLDYSMSVIVSRALPDVKDGLKPSQRRIMVAMSDLNLTSTAHFRKSAKIAGDTSGNYHPHGEQVIYPTMVKLAQDFSTRYLLINGQGNFGTVDGDSAAAMRYTEARMTKLTEEMLKDLDKGTVTWEQNYDGTRLEPTLLPTRFPQLLANGTDGIAVGMATKIPPHNLKELIKALRTMIKEGNKWEGKAAYNDLRITREKAEAIPKTLNSKPTSHLQNYINTELDSEEVSFSNIREQLEKDKSVLYPQFKSEITPTELIKIIPGPDFPLGGIIYDQSEILNAYATGRGRILQRGKATIGENAKGRFHIVITEIPYQVNKATMIKKIADLYKEKKITGISDLRDESNYQGMRIVIELKRDAQPKSVLNKLYKYTQMQSAFNANMISLIDQEPKTMGIKQMLEEFLNFRLTVVIRRYEFDLAEARYRGHILEGLLKALDMLDEIIAAIRASKTQEDAKEALITKFEFTTVQAQAILDMQLRRLAALERDKLQNEFDDIEAKIKDYNIKLASPEEILTVIDGELEEISKKHGDARRTKVVKGKVDDISEEDLVADEETFVTISHSGYIKRVAPDTYKKQNRGGKGVMGATTKEGDFIEHAFACSTHDSLLLFSNKGRVFKTKVYEVPEYGRTAKGLPLVNLVQLETGELVTSVLTLSKDGVMGEDEIQEDQEKKKVVKRKDLKYLFMATKAGTVKKTTLEQFDKIRATGLIAVNLDEGDELQWVRPTTGKNDIILVTKYGRSIRFNEDDVRATGRNTRGVRGMKFKDKEDELIAVDVVRDDENQLFTLSEKGYGKMTPLVEYPTQGRGGSGVFTFRVTDKTGKLAVARIMDHPDKEIVVISEKGQVIRSSVSSVSTLGRQTSGVKVMTMKKTDNVAAMAIL